MSLFASSELILSDHQQHCRCHIHSAEPYYGSN